MYFSGNLILQLYNLTIKTNLKKFLYKNDEYYAADIIDYLIDTQINLEEEEVMFNNAYTDFNILRIMVGMGGLSYTN